MDREWSSTLLDPRAVGWDWTGLNLPDGGALMAFQVRAADGTPLWAGGTLRAADGRTRRFAPGEVRFTAVRRWRSPRTGGVYPVEQEVAVALPGGERRWRLTPLMDDQELDSRASGGPVYWEGAVQAPDGARGYLELTGYVGALKL
jgi:predicted secreted hydrolase